jgi:hypothetical protein
MLSANIKKSDAPTAGAFDAAQAETLPVHPSIQQQPTLNEIGVTRASAAPTATFMHVWRNEICGR